jgi:hypothetical protein
MTNLLARVREDELEEELRRKPIDARSMQWDGNWEDAAKLAEYLDASEHTLVGSTFILGEGKDVDWLFLVPDMREAAAFLLRKGWLNESGEPYPDEEDGFLSLRAGNVNVLLTQNVSFYEDFETAAHVCKLLKVADRNTRVKVHRAILYGELPE